MYEKRQSPNQKPNEYVSYETARCIIQLDPSPVDFLTISYKNEKAQTMKLNEFPH